MKKKKILIAVDVSGSMQLGLGKEDQVEFTEFGVREAQSEGFRQKKMSIFRRLFRLRPNHFDASNYDRIILFTDGWAHGLPTNVEMILVKEGGSR